MNIGLVIESTIKALPALADKRAELQALSNSLRSHRQEVAIGLWAAGVVALLGKAPAKNADGWVKW